VVCGEKLRITGPSALWFYTDVLKREKWSAHVDCVKEKGLPSI
jgi:hypothetical protein